MYFETIVQLQHCIPFEIPIEYLYYLVLRTENVNSGHGGNVLKSSGLISDYLCYCEAQGHTQTQHDSTS